MSRVTIGDITEDLLPFTAKGNKVIPIEIVPRVIVEKIIAECQYFADTSKPMTGNLYAKGVADLSNRIIQYAEFLLRDFEEGGE